jgi:hypothetical protein
MDAIVTRRKRGGRILAQAPDYPHGFRSIVRIPAQLSARVQRSPIFLITD